jgi:hypothetical protein
MHVIVSLLQNKTEIRTRKQVSFFSFTKKICPKRLKNVLASIKASFQCGYVGAPASYFNLKYTHDLTVKRCRMCAIERERGKKRATHTNASRADIITQCWVIECFYFRWFARYMLHVVCNMSHTCRAGWGRKFNVLFALVGFPNALSSKIACLCSFVFGVSLEGIYRERTICLNLIRIIQKSTQYR